MVSLPSHWWGELSTREFAALDMSQVIAILPVGAIEQHGPHLPVCVDAAINAGILARAVELMPSDLPALILPPMPVGKSNEHMAFPGTLSLPYDLLARLWFEIAKSTWHTGVRKIILFNAHGGQPQIMDIVCRDLRVELCMLAVSASWYHLADSSDLYNAEERQHGIHGGESETSIMLHLHPRLVQMEHARNFESHAAAIAKTNKLLTPEGGIGFGWQTQDLNPFGACGNARAADAHRGNLEVERAAQGLIALIREVQDYPLAALKAKTAYMA